MKNLNKLINNQTVKLSDVDDADTTYRITTETNISALMVSIGHVGLLNPPFLIKHNSKYTIISGFRRIKAYRSLSRSQVTARILVPETKQLECARLAIADNALQRPLNLIEQSRAISLLSGIIKDDSKLSEELSALSLPENQSVIKKIKKLCHLSSPLQKAILSNTISLPVALKLGELAPAIGTGFVALFENLKLSLNKQREILTLVEEIALREDIPVLEVLNDKRLTEILNHPELDRNQKARQLRMYLRKRRFPALTRAENSFDLLIKELKLGKDINLIPPKNFEGMTYTFTLNFKNMIELKDRKASFDNIIQNPALKKFEADNS